MTLMKKRKKRERKENEELHFFTLLICVISSYLCHLWFPLPSRPKGWLAIRGRIAYFAFIRKNEMP